MAKKKKVDIVKQLNALNPSIPTRTRTRNDISDDIPPDPNPLVVESGRNGFAFPPFHAVELFFENVSALGKLRQSMMEDAFRFQGLFFESWGKACRILYDAMRANVDGIGPWVRRR